MSSNRAEFNRRLDDIVNAEGMEVLAWSSEASRMFPYIDPLTHNKNILLIVNDICFKAFYFKAKDVSKEILKDIRECTGTVIRIWENIPHDANDKLKSAYRLSKFLDNEGNKYTINPSGNEFWGQTQDNLLIYNMKFTRI